MKQDFAKDSANHLGQKRDDSHPMIKFGYGSFGETSGSDVISNPSGPIVSVSHADDCSRPCQ